MADRPNSFPCPSTPSRTLLALPPLAWLGAWLLMLLLVAPPAHAQRIPPDCAGSGLGITLFTSVPDVHIGDTLHYSINVFNGIPGSGRIACDAGSITAFIVTPDGRTNQITLRRTTLHQGDQDFYENVVSYVVRAQDIKPDGTLLATARTIGIIYQNDVPSSGGGFQGVNTQVNLPCVLISALCVSSVGETGAITFTGFVTNCGNNTLVGITVTNFYDAGNFTVVFPTNLARGQSLPFSGSYIPANPCVPSVAILTVRATDEFTATPRTVTNFTTIVCQNTLNPAVRVAKVCPTGPVGPGQLLVFSGSVTNTGNVTLTNIVVLNNQPSANTTVFTLASLAPGAVAHFTGSYIAPTACSVSDTLVVRASSVCGVAVTDSVSATCTILTTPQIVVTAVCPITPTARGGTITYTGTVRNSGNITLTDVAVVTSRPNMILLGGRLTTTTSLFAATSLAPGQSANFTASYFVLSDTCSFATEFTATGRDICTLNLATHTVSATCPLVTTPGITVTLACPIGSATTGGPITYTGTVRNSGNVTLNNVAVVNSLNGPTPVFTTASLAPGATATFTANFTAPADACSVTSTVTATGTDECSAAPVSHTASATCSLATTPAIVVTHTCPVTPTTPGALFTYNGTVRNTGNISLTNVVVLNNRSGSTPVFTAASLAPGATASFTGSFLTPADCSISSTSTASGRSICGVAVTDSATAACPILTSPAIVVTQTCPATSVLPGGLLTYSGTVSNAGNITLTGIVVVNNRPAPNTVILTRDSLAPGDTASFTGSYQVPLDCCVVSSTVQARGVGCDGATVTDTASRTCTVLTTPRLVITKTCPPQPLRPGDLLSFSGSVSNAGNITLTDVFVVNSRLPAGSPVLGPLIIAPGESVDYFGSYIVPPDFCGADTVTVTGFDSCTEATVTANATTTCPIVSAPGIAVTLTCPPSPTPRGGIHSFTGAVSNTGDVTLTDVFVVGNQPVNNTTLIGPITLAPGASVPFTGTFAAPDACCEILNIIAARGRDLCTAETVTAGASALCPLLSTPVITVTRVCPPSPVPVGGLFVFNGTVRNSGDITLTNVFVQSSQPASALRWLPGTSGGAVSLATLPAHNQDPAALLANVGSCRTPNIGRSATSTAGNGTSMLGPIELAPGESKQFTGSYTVVSGSDPTADTLTARGIDTCQARIVSITVNCAGPVGPAGPPNLNVTTAAGMVTVSWTASPGATYSVESQAGAGQPWIPVPGTITARGTDASIHAPMGSAPQRFYRVLIVNPNE